jgi:hypothetical protein
VCGVLGPKRLTSPACLAYRAPDEAPLAKCPTCITLDAMLEAHGDMLCANTVINIQKEKLKLQLLNFAKN